MERLEAMALVAHEANRAIQEANGEEVSPPWENAPDWQRESSLAGVAKALAGQTPEQLHESWCDEKRQQGWVFGEEKDPEAKTHPCLVPYSQLPADQRLKDYVYRAVIHATAKVLDSV